MGNRTGISCADAAGPGNHGGKKRRRTAYVSGARPQHGEGRTRKCSLGCRGKREATAAMEAPGRHATRNQLRSIDWHSGFTRTVAGENRSGTGSRLPANQGKSEARVGRRCSSEDPEALAED